MTLTPQSAAPAGSVRRGVMSDIIERCRAKANDPFGTSLCDEAADELDRLHKKNSELNGRCQQLESAVAEKIRDTPRGGMGKALLASAWQMTEDKLQRAETEIERLRAFIDASGYGGALKQLDRAEAVIEAARDYDKHFYDGDRPLLRARLFSAFAAYDKDSE